MKLNNDDVVFINDRIGWGLIFETRVELDDEGPFDMIHVLLATGKTEWYTTEGFLEEEVIHAGG